MDFDSISLPNTKIEVWRKCLFAYGCLCVCVSGPSLNLQVDIIRPTLCRRSNRELILQPFRRFIYVTTYSPTLPSLYLHHSSLSNPSVASSTSQFIIQPFFRFSYVTRSLLNSPGEPPMLKIKMPAVRFLSHKSPVGRFYFLQICSQSHSFVPAISHFVL